MTAAPEPSGAGPDHGTLASEGLTVSVAALAKAVGTARHEVRRGVIAGLGSVSASVPDGAPVTVDVVLSSYPDGMMVTGTVAAAWHGECRRCGGDVEGLLVAAVRERFVRDADIGDEEAYPLLGDELDLEALARDAVLLELPLAPLCAAECLGLCPECGANWNFSSCTCRRGDPRWAALDELRRP